MKVFSFFLYNRQVQIWMLVSSNTPYLQIVKDSLLFFQKCELPNEKIRQAFLLESE